MPEGRRFAPASGLPFLSTVATISFPSMKPDVAVRSKQLIESDTRL